MADRRPFGQRELDLLGQALSVAEESVSDHYGLSEGDWRDYPYELRTLAQLVPGEVSRRALAQVLKLREPERPAWRGRRDFFRICLQDHNLREVIRRERADELLLPLMTYVTAHELVHVVRFYRFQHLFEAAPRERAPEEIRVHAITARALKRVHLPRLGEVLRLYAKHGGGSLGCAA